MPIILTGPPALRPSAAGPPPSCHPSVRDALSLYPACLGTLAATLALSEGPFDHLHSSQSTTQSHQTAANWFLKRVSPYPVLQTFNMHI